MIVTFWALIAIAYAMLIASVTLIPFWAKAYPTRPVRAKRIMRAGYALTWGALVPFSTAVAPFPSTGGLS